MEMIQAKCAKQKRSSYCQKSADKHHSLRAVAMLIQSMTRMASLKLLERANFGRVACSHEGQPYLVPMSVTYDVNWLYCFSTLGQKITWMRANPRVCVEIEELVSRQDWATVIVMGRYDELTTDADRKYAHDLLQRRPAWWEAGYSRTVIEGKERHGEGVCFRILIEQITGHRAIPE
jgi:nitroimidazol reductase NimA-like FMN-containing flavoprotein (pyridoxamine 5'-phosphate oxidase superfamily)